MESIEELAEAVARMTPCSCSAQRARAEAAEAKLRDVEAATEWRDAREFGDELTPFSNGARKMAMRVRAALATHIPADEREGWGRA